MKDTAMVSRMTGWQFVVLLIVMFSIVQPNVFADDQMTEQVQQINQEYEKIKELYAPAASSEAEQGYQTIESLYEQQHDAVSYRQLRPAIKPTPVKRTLPPGENFGEKEFREKVTAMGESKKAIRLLRGRVQEFRNNIRDARERMDYDIEEMEYLTKEVMTESSAVGNVIDSTLGQMGRLTHYFFFGMGDTEQLVIDRARSVAEGKSVLPEERQRILLLIHDYEENGAFIKKASPVLERLEKQLNEQLRRSQASKNKPIPFPTENVEGEMMPLKKEKKKDQMNTEDKTGSLPLESEMKKQ